MDFSNFQNVYIEIFQKNQLDAYIKDEYIEKFEQLTRIMLETNAVMNLTALTTMEKIIPLHYADCVMAAEHIPENSTVLDVGCGGGFPILPLAIVRPDLHLTGLDSTEKKAKYVQSAADQLGLSVQTLTARAEELGRKAEHREKYDIVISRAVARLNILDELCMPFVRTGGCFVAMKGAAGPEEAKEAAQGLARLGGGRISEESTVLRTFSGIEERRIYLVFKTRPTPPEYPRAFGNIKRKPL